MQDYPTLILLLSIGIMHHHINGKADNKSLSMQNVHIIHKNIMTLMKFLEHTKEAAYVIRINIKDG